MIEYHHFSPEGVHCWASRGISLVALDRAGRRLDRESHKELAQPPAANSAIQNEAKA